MARRVGGRKRKCPNSISSKKVPNLNLFRKPLEGNAMIVKRTSHSNFDDAQVIMHILMIGRPPAAVTYRKQIKYSSIASLVCMPPSKVVFLSCTSIEKCKYFFMLRSLLANIAFSNLP